MISWRTFVALSKPTIVLLVAVTGIATSLAEGTFFTDPAFMLIALALIVIAAASANSLNQYIDRDIDAIMDRTRKRRPLPLQKIEPSSVLLFGIGTGIFSTAALYYFFSLTAALLSAGTILFYVLVYTAWLKRRHPYNIVIGGAAGATAPLIISAAADGKISWIAWLGFWMIFTWTPPHFWALALAIKDQYKRVNVPMMPVVWGERRTKIEIVVYTLALLPLGSLPLWMYGASYWIVGFSILLWVWYFVETIVRLFLQPNPSSFYRLFYVSIFYLFFYFIVLSFHGGGA